MHLRETQHVGRTAGGDYEGMESYLKTRIAWLDKTMKNMDEQIEK